MPSNSPEHIALTPEQIAADRTVKYLLEMPNTLLQSAAAEATSRNQSTGDFILSLIRQALGNGKPDVSEGVKPVAWDLVCPWEAIDNHVTKSAEGAENCRKAGWIVTPLYTSPTKPDVSGSGEVAAPDDNVVARVRQWLQDYDAQAAEDLEDGEIAKVDAEVEFRRDDIRHLLDLVASPSPEGVQGDLVVPGIFLDLEAARMVYAALNFLQPKNYVSEIREPLEQVLAAFKGQLEVAEAGQQSVALTAAHQTGGETPESGLKS